MYNCLDCRRIDPCYKVQDSVWLAAVPDYEELQRTLRADAKKRGLEGAQLRAASFVGLCFTCLSNRLGRDLTLEDFTSDPVNEGIRFGHQLGLGRTLARTAS